MDGKTIIELDNDIAEKFKLFCMIEAFTKGKTYEYTKSQFYPDGRMIVHFCIKKLTK